MHRENALLGLSLLIAGCTPELGDVPFACTQDPSCPEGYTCRSGACVRDGTTLPTSRVKRVEWINSAEMFWFPAKQGGATLVVNDGFTNGGHGFFEIHVSPSGEAGFVHTLFNYGNQFAVSSAVVALSDGRFGIVTLNFPNIDGSNITLKVLAVERDAKDGATPAIETLYADEEPFQGGVEPTYVGAVSGTGYIDLAWTRPSLGGRVEVLRLAREGSLYKPQTTLSIPLPTGILPLSGDCLLFDVGGDQRVVRVGYELFALATADMVAGTSSDFAVHDGLPVFAWSDKALVLRYGEADESAGTIPVTYALTDLANINEFSSDSGGLLQTTTDPYTGIAYGDGMLIAPQGTDPTFSSIGLAFRSPSQALTPFAHIDRQSTGQIYSPRAFVHENKVYLAWTEFRETYMDLWVGVADLNSAAGTALIHSPKPVPVLSVPRIPHVESPGSRTP